MRRAEHVSATPKIIVTARPKVWNRKREAIGVLAAGLAFAGNPASAESNPTQISTGGTKSSQAIEASIQTTAKTTESNTSTKLPPLKLADAFKLKGSVFKDDWLLVTLSALSQSNGTTTGMPVNQYTSSNLITLGLQIGPFTADKTYSPSKEATSVADVAASNTKSVKAYQRLSLNAVFTQRAGEILSSKIPNILNTQWGYGNGPIARLNILNVEYRNPDGLLTSVKIGKLMQAQDFTVNPVQCFFSNFGLCGWAQGTPYMVSIPGNPFNSYGAVVKFGKETHTRLKYGVYQLAPATFATQYHGLDFRLDQGIGTAQFLELNIPLNSPKQIPVRSPLTPDLPGVTGSGKPNAMYETVLPPTSLTLGGWLGTGQFAYLASSSSAKQYGSQNNGIYGIASVRLPIQGLGLDNRLFASSSIGLNPEVQNFSSGGNAGLVVAGLFAKRPFDTLALGVAYGSYNPNYYLGGTQTASFTPTNEVALELNYNIALNKSISVMPNYQYIIQPAGDSRRSGVSVIGMQIWLRF